MDVLVIGGTGFLSSAVVAELSAAGHRVTVFTRGRRPLPEGVEAITGDRSDHAAFAAHFEGRPFDAVVDCICFRPEEAQAGLRAFSGRVRHFLMISTDFVYGPRRVLPMDEDTPLRAMSQYGRDKAACEALLMEAWAEERFPVTVLRPPHI
ncbi:MAG TPA: NAD-dependent epimerase/dehydratase family protein, partial [Armatimonadota bacterium]|nr:NAD-dependent epimerase/dehydratase family protein [Armatimonadota bacterium]